MFRLQAVFRELARGQYARHGLFAFVAVMSVNVANYVFQAVASRLLGIAQFGEVAALLAMVNLATVPGFVALMIVARSAAEYHALQDHARLRRLVDTFAFQGVLLGAVLAAVIIALERRIAEYLRIADTHAVFAAALFVAGSSIVPAFRGTLQGVSDFRGFLVSNAVEGFGRAAFGIAAIAAGFGVAGAIGGLALATVPAMLASWLLLLPRLRVRPERLRLPFMRIVQTVGGVTASTACMLMLSGADVIFVKHYFDAESAGIYGAINLIGRIVFFGLSFVPQVVLPSAAGRAARGLSATSVLMKAQLVALVLGSVGIAAALAIPNVLIRVVAGPAYSVGSVYLASYVAAMMVLSMANVAATFNVAVHDFRYLIVMVPLTIAEVGGFIVFHDSLAQVITVVATIAALVLIGTLALTPRHATAGFTPPTAAEDHSQVH